MLKMLILKKHHFQICILFSNNVSEISGEIQRNGTNTPTDNRSENSSNEMLNDVPGCLSEYKTPWSLTGKQDATSSTN